MSNATSTNPVIMIYGNPETFDNTYGLLQNSTNWPPSELALELPTVLNAMWNLLDLAKTASLTAPQVGNLVPPLPPHYQPAGLLSRIFILDTSRLGETPGERLVIINPVVTSISADTTNIGTDSCLCLPPASNGGVVVPLAGTVGRATTVTLSFLTDQTYPAGPLQTHTFTGRVGFAVQHALDHLNGKLCYANWLATERFAQQTALNNVYNNNFPSPTSYPCYPPGISPGISPSKGSKK